MSSADASAPVHDARPEGNASIVRIVAAAVFACAALVFVLFYVYKYTVWCNGRLSDVLFGLWGLYWGVTLAWGALRIVPCEHRQGIFNAFLWAAVAQGFFIVLLWGVCFLGVEEIESAAGAIRTIGYWGAAACCAGPLLALGFAFTSRRWLVLVLAEVLGPTLFWALHMFGG